MLEVVGLGGVGLGVLCERVDCGLAWLRKGQRLNERYSVHCRGSRE